jgi:uncharacterized membrane-anchored protein YitT (DUF2179 family)
MVLNFPFYIGKNSWYHICCSSFFTFILIAASMTFIQIDAVTSDRLLIALFGGCLVGMGLCIRSGSVADGIEILALLTTRKIGLNVSEVILASIVLFFYPLLGSLVVPHYTLLSLISPLLNHLIM